MKLTDDSKVRIIYFSDEKISKQILIFDGSAKQIKEEQFGIEWDGLSLGDRFHLNDEEVRVYTVKHDIDDDKVSYIVGPSGLSPYKIESDKINV